MAEALPGSSCADRRSGALGAQRTEGEPVVVVRNTFLDVAPPRQALNFQRTTPGRIEGTGDAAPQEEPAEVWRPFTVEQPRGLPAGGAEVGLTQGHQAPRPAALERLSTEALRESLAEASATGAWHEAEHAADGACLGMPVAACHDPLQMGIPFCIMLPVMPMCDMAGLPGTEEPAFAGEAARGAREAAPAGVAPMVLPLRAPPPPRFESAWNPITGASRFIFNVPASKLETRDKTVVSDQFELPLGSSSVPFRIKITAKMMHDRKHGQCFKTARGQGKVELKCEGVPPPGSVNVKFHVIVGSGDNRQARGPVTHNFLSSSIGGLPADQEEWDFRAHVDPATMSLSVCVEVACDAT